MAGINFNFELFLKLFNEEECCLEFCKDFSKLALSFFEAIEADYVAPNVSDLLRVKSLNSKEESELLESDSS